MVLFVAGGVMGRALTLLATFLVLLAVWFGISPPAESPPRSGEQDLATPNPSDYPAELTPDTLRRIEHWLRRRGGDVERAQPPRDVFSQARDRPIPTTAEATFRPVDDAPRLVGFVFSGEQGGETHPLAAIYFEETMWLVDTGKRIGPYLVQQMIAGEEVTLFDPASGEGLLLSLN